MRKAVKFEGDMEKRDVMGYVDHSDEDMTWT